MFFFGLALLGTITFALISFVQAYTAKTVFLQRFQISIFCLLYLAILCFLAFRDPHSPLLFDYSNTSQGEATVFVLPIVITALFSIYHVFLLFGFSVWSSTAFNAERLYSYFLVFLSAMGLVGSEDPIWILLLMELTGFATIGLIATQGSSSARSSAFTYLLFSSIATLLYCFGVTYAIPRTAELFSPVAAHFALVPSLLIGTAFLIKLGLGPFARYLVDGQTVALYPDFTFISTVGKLPYLLSLFNLAPVMFSEGARTLLMMLALIFATVAAVLMMATQTIRRFFAYSSLFNSALAVVLLLFSDQLASFFIAYMSYYICISLLLYLSFSFFGAPIETGFRYPQPEPRTFGELANRTVDGASFAFWTALLFNSGLPPFGIFVAKAIGLGFLFLHSDVSTTGYILVFTLLFISMVNMVAYFRAMLVAPQKSPNSAAQPTFVGPLVTTKEKNDQFYTWGVYLFYSFLLMLVPLYYDIFQSLI
jgi:NADH:ubiquinone oxidoreductase subunit 2 (subunit N)